MWDNLLPFGHEQQMRSLSPEPTCWDLQQLVVHRHRDGDRFYLNLLVGICRG
ncbi:hypothetical protein PQG02_36845 (plasmid) [Nostoc sp. UHCC 0926]|uniref:hypothetical protein n=1 Tax=Nostoc sp. UHCC 0926 TaxID=3025190 RepID=UPI0023624068|nr:hypothetical protein [Nostoc sp. UHCC 0926]WDD36670.1 hypothetical protein PQG02_36845 [Nostoc sp. UHCC 0926]